MSVLLEGTGKDREHKYLSQCCGYGDVCSRACHGTVQITSGDNGPGTEQD